MKENVAISKKKQKSFQTSVDNYKKLLKTGQIQIDENVAPKKTTKVRTPRGLVFLSNIPHGFYEDEMKEYFNQFGIVTRLRLARSKNTGRSKCYAFIEFKIPEVAEIVAETMNNFLMCKRLLKAKYIPPDEQHGGHFRGKNYTSEVYPKIKNRELNILRDRSDKTDKKVLETAGRLLKGVEKIKKKLLEVGIIYNFEPVDIPPQLKQNKNETTTEKESDKNDTSESECESENDVPTLFVHESDDSDIVFNAPPGIKTVIVKKAEIEEDEKPKSKKLKTNGKSKLVGISKKAKSKNMTTKLPITRASKKLQLIQKNILDENQISLKSMKEIKNKKKFKK